MVNTLHLHCRGHGLHPWWGNQDPTCFGQKKIQKRRISLVCACMISGHWKTHRGDSPCQLSLPCKTSFKILALVCDLIYQWLQKLSLTHENVPLIFLFLHSFIILHFLFLLLENSLFYASVSPSDKLVTWIL